MILCWRLLSELILVLQIGVELVLLLQELIQGVKLLFAEEELGLVALLQVLHFIDNLFLESLLELKVLIKIATQIMVGFHDVLKFHEAVHYVGYLLGVFVLGILLWLWLLSLVQLQLLRSLADWSY